MKRFMFLSLFLFVVGCSSLKVLPEPAENGTISEKENSQTIVRDGLAITARIGDLETLAYNLDYSVSSFFVVIDNQTDGEVSFDNDSFLLVDTDGRQYFPLTPEKVKEIVSRDTYYLLPYPYVGFYYLEDYEKSSADNRFTSDRPYFYEIYPQDIYTKAIPVGSIIPKSKVVGLVYFRIDLADKNGVRLMVYKKGASKASKADFVFPFKIVK